MTSSLARVERRLRAKGQTRHGVRRRTDGPSAPLLVNLSHITVEDMRPGMSYRPEWMMLRISTPPVFGEAGNECRYFEFPVTLPVALRHPTPESASIALEILKKHQCVNDAIAELAVLARTPASRAYAKTHAAFANL